MEKKEWKAWQREGQVGTKDRLLSPVSLAVSCHLHQETCHDHQSKRAAEVRASSCRIPTKPRHSVAPGPRGGGERVLLPSYHTVIPGGCHGGDVWWLEGQQGGT